MRVRRVNVLRMIKRRALGASLPYSTCCHTFRATGITAYLEGRRWLSIGISVVAFVGIRIDGTTQIHTNFAEKGRDFVRAKLLADLH